MPPLPAIDSVVKCVFSQDNSPLGAGVVNTGVNILHLQYPGTVAFTAVELIATANSLMTWWGNHFSPSLAPSWQLSHVTCTAADGSGVQGVSTTAVKPGTGVGSPLPPQSSVCVSWKGAPAYRGGKPRMYLCGIPGTVVVGGTSQIQSGYATTLRTAAIAAIADMAPMTIGGAQPLLGAVSYVKKAVNPTPPHYRPTPLFWQYLSAQVHERLDSQRRRSGKEAAFAVA
jgi:hypothetical protein